MGIPYFINLFILFISLPVDGHLGCQVPLFLKEIRYELPLGSSLLSQRCYSSIVGVLKIVAYPYTFPPSSVMSYFFSPTFFFLLVQKLYMISYPYVETFKKLLESETDILLGVIYSFINLNTFIDLCSLHNQYRAVASLQKICHAIPLLSYSPNHCNHRSVFHHYSFVVLRIPYKWKHIVCNIFETGFFHAAYTFEIT